MAILPEVTAVLLPQNSMDKCPVDNVLVEGKLEMAVLPAVTAVLLHPSITTQAVQYITMS